MGLPTNPTRDNNIMSAMMLAKIIGQSIEVECGRTGVTHTVHIEDAKENYGKLRVRAHGSIKWFELTMREVEKLEL